ncbi:hypothetical protein [Fructobacillus fructosus]|uniref:hypothetical protein n=1 Tax=Fructobacillus fructosus TaxID=1631 RepID=UPI00200AA4AE|nr:hypothetical protein [Fructobacillus fructosus]MCK8638824.1 hypothetical protein [Fructobacillus fructosus]
MTATEKSAQKQAVETAKQQGQANIDAATDNSELPNTSKSIEKNKNSGLWALILTLISGLLVTKKRNDQY